MRNQMLLNLYAVFILLAPANVLSYFMDEPTDAAAHTNLENLSQENEPIEQLMETSWKTDSNTQSEKEKEVTTSETSRMAATEEGPSTQEEKKQAFEDWAKTLPVYEEDSHQAQFIQTIAPAAVLIAHQQGIYPSVMIAQASLESSWGQSGLAQDYNNLMGTKGSWNGESITFRTREDINGESVYIDAGFSVYDSWADSLYRYGLLMAKGLEWDPNYYSGTWRQNADTYQEATAWLQGRYATDSAYAAKLNATIESFNLDQYDEVEPFTMDLEDVIDELAI